MILRRLLAAVAILATLTALACAGMAVLRWRSDRAASAAAVALSQPPPPVATTDAPAMPSAVSPPAVVRRLDVAWHDGEDRPLRSRISIDSAGGALVETFSDGQALVSYRGTATTRADGTLVIDASHAAVSGAMAADWVPDSFAIRADGSVTIHDGRHPPCRGYLAQESTPR